MADFYYMLQAESSGGVRIALSLQISEIVNNVAIFEFKIFKKFTIIVLDKLYNMVQTNFQNLV